MIWTMLRQQLIKKLNKWIIIFFKQLSKLTFSQKSRIIENKNCDKDIELVSIKSPLQNAFNFSDAYKKYRLVSILYVLRP